MMFLRYLVALPLILTSYVGVPFAYLTLSSQLFRRSLPGGTSQSFTTGFTETFTEHISGFWPVPVALVLFAALWWMTTAWPRIALLPSAPLAFTGLFSGTFDKTLLAVAAPAVAWGLAQLAAKSVSWPLTRDVRRSAAEVVVGLRGEGRLRVQSRRLLLDKLPPPLQKGSPVGRVAIRFDRIKHVEAGAVRTAAKWRLGNTSELTITPGPVLRIIGGGQEWLLPVDDVETTARLVLERAEARSKAEPRPPMDSSRWTSAKHLWKLQDAPVLRPNLQKVRHGAHHMMLVLSALTTAMAGFAAFRMFTGDWTFVFGALFFGGVALGSVLSWASIGATQKLTEENPRSPLDGDPDPHRTPVTGWSPRPASPSRSLF
ncbi:hypothetical protein [Lentzea sp. CC55]|uniref:hypothetical protein n=1 Tax=Lentzea sp. CC55 TaxID=2884909 RepID=UPI001F2B25BF|nr:hypothetical protein [Lentzea sp. CC55]MCG8923094.1 hypothetical protein [Lentzea sp. CC55]